MQTVEDLCTAIYMHGARELRQVRDSCVEHPSNGVYVRVCTGECAERVCSVGTVVKCEQKERECEMLPAGVKTEALCRGEPHSD